LQLHGSIAKAGVTQNTVNKAMIFKMVFMIFLPIITTKNQSEHSNRLHLIILLDWMNENGHCFSLYSPNATG